VRALSACPVLVPVVAAAVGEAIPCLAQQRRCLRRATRLRAPGNLRDAVLSTNRPPSLGVRACNAPVSSHGTPFLCLVGRPGRPVTGACALAGEHPAPAHLHVRQCALPHPSCSAYALLLLMRCVAAPHATPCRRLGRGCPWSASMYRCCGGEGLHSARRSFLQSCRAMQACHVCAAAPSLHARRGSR
jgi:hypothetical protein